MGLVANPDEDPNENANFKQLKNSSTTSREILQHNTPLHFLLFLKKTGHIYFPHAFRMGKIKQPGFLQFCAKTEEIL